MPGLGTTVLIPPDDIDFLTRRGARSQRGWSPFSRSAVLHRTMQTHRLLLEHCDPRKTRGLSEDMHLLAVGLLPEPWTLSRFEVQHLAKRFALSPDLAAEAGGAGIEVEDFLAAITALTFPEKLALVDQAIQAHVAELRRQ
ncbi:MAG TPA: hypothetical protein VHQ90_00885 [Thermoanaerobaculia bacterium]|nr:hypothetical protein [Thermoanaerobaculia bacterium]